MTVASLDSKQLQTSVCTM